MTTQTLKLNAETFAKIGHYETSIQHWSTEYTVLTLRAKKTLEGIDSLYVARQKIIDEILEEGEIDIKRVKDVKILADGEIQVELLD
jgi:hypothetical protein